MESIPEIAGDTLLYKYRSFATDKYVGFARDIILNHQLYCAPPRSFNDPFDCHASFCFEATEGEKIDRAVARLCKEDPYLPEDEARISAPQRYKMVESIGPEQIRSLVENKLGVVSFAAVLDNLLLWAHYASGHSGICIQFSASELAHGEFFGNILPVEYEIELPVVSFYRDNQIQQVRKHLLTKSRDWAYEYEWRIIVKNRQEQPYYSFDPKLVTAVYLGCQMSLEKRALVQEWLRNRDSSTRPRIFQARPSNTAYRLEFELLD